MPATTNHHDSSAWAHAWAASVCLLAGLFCPDGGCRVSAWFLSGLIGCVKNSFTKPAA